MNRYDKLTLCQAFEKRFKLLRALIVTVALALGAFSSVAAQSLIKILHFDKTTGIIDCGEDAGLRVGDVFEVNRYAGDFVYWIGRVEVVLVKPKMAGVKTLVLAENATIQQGDVLELRKRDYDPLLEKRRQSAQNGKNIESGNSARQEKNETAALGVATGSSRRAKPVIFGISAGGLQPVSSSSQSLGLNLSLQIVNLNNRIVRQIDMSRAYAASMTSQAFCSLPFSSRWALNFDYAYTWLNVKSAMESSLLEVGLKASGSLMKIGTALNYRFSHRMQFNLGVGLFLPQVTIKGGRQSITVSERRWGGTAELSYFFPLGSTVWLRSVLEYNIFQDNGPSIHYLSVQTGPSFTIGKH